MRFAAVLNRDGGTLRTTDLDAFTQRMRARLEAADHTLDVEIVHSRQVDETIRAVAARDDVDIVLVGGGDGTVSCAAGIVSQTPDKVLAVLPAGTMNLFARGLGIPQTLDTAVDAFATGEIHPIDLASANGQFFAHQFSIGMHAKMVHLRDRMSFSSRLGKIMASVKAAYHTVLKPPSLRVSMDIDGKTIETKTSGVGISNNLFGEGHLPYADDPDGGVLGIYITAARHRGDLLHFAFNLLRGRWKTNTQVQVHTARTVILRTGSKKRHTKVVIDGELSTLEPETRLQIHPKALRVLVPADVLWAKAA